MDVNLWGKSANPGSDCPVRTRSLEQEFSKPATLYGLWDAPFTVVWRNIYASIGIYD
jgi:DNA/RNA-binding domain of Phe-tRNA-synthetase-like protein